MKFIPMRDLRINASAVLDQLAEENVIVTRNGKPAAAMIFLDEDLLDDFILSQHPTLLRELEKDRADYKKHGGGISHAEMKARIARKRA